MFVLASSRSDLLLNGLVEDLEVVGELSLRDRFGLISTRKAADFVEFSASTLDSFAV